MSQARKDKILENFVKLEKDLRKQKPSEELSNCLTNLNEACSWFKKTEQAVEKIKEV